jgi:RND family efflux transporter MFP subunit
VDIGDEVRPKQSLARLDTADLNLNIASARANVAAVEADVANARAELNRVNELYRKQFIGKAALDNAQAAYDAANARLTAARSQLKLSGNQAAYTELYADKAGLITALSAEVGQVVGAGQPIMHIAYDGDREVHIRVGETASTQLKAGQLVNISLWAQAQQSLQGKIREISPTTDSTRSFLVKISLLNAPSDLRLGLTADVSIPNVAHADASFIPSTALFQEGKQPAVWVVNDKHEVHLQPITIMSYQEDGINVAGLTNGTQIIAAGVHKLNNGQVINPVPYDGKAGS